MDDLRGTQGTPTGAKDSQPGKVSAEDPPWITDLGGQRSLYGYHHTELNLHSLG